jgi:hypothetical protein
VQFSNSAFNRSVYAELDAWIAKVHVDEISAPLESVSA